MDTSKTAYARVKINGVREPIMFNDGIPMTLLMPKIIGRLKAGQYQVRDSIVIDISFKGPIEAYDSEDERIMAETNEYFKSVASTEEEMFASLEENQAALFRLIMDPETRDDIQEYRRLSEPSYRMTKSNEYVRVIKDKIESEYKDKGHIIMWDLGDQFWQ